MAKEPSDYKPLIDFFLNLYRVQVAGEGSPADAAAVIVSESDGGDIIYELSVRHNGATKTRRMSIRSLGEQVESKSRCYKVIYDDQLVVKIPPRPITEFESYLNHIRQEHAIATRLTPSIPCVYPHLGAILKKVPSLRLPPDLPPERTEPEYIHRLTQQPDFQKYLRISGGFVFFMNLSRYGFFNQVIDAIHHCAQLVHQEILRNGPGAVADYHHFECLFGACNDSLHFEMNALIKAYERAIERIIRESGTTVWIADYQVQEWFFTRLAGSRPEFDHAELPPELADSIDALIIGLLASKKTAVDGFRRLVQEAVNRKRFDTNRARIRGLAIHVIELLYRLKSRSVAIRDLKPDNMYVAAQIDGADHILADPDAYQLGLIDLETAVCIETGDGTVPQPLLAGTPSYATPTHIFNNALLCAVYGKELPRILYLQDWYAGLVMIFNVVTGKALFTKPARLMLEISRMRRKDPRNPRSQMAVFESGGRTFWKAAADELAASLEKNGAWLRDVKIDLPEHLAQFLADECRKERRIIDRQIETCIDRCRPAEKYREKLIAASHDRICRIMSQGSGSISGWDDFAALLSRIKPFKCRRERLDREEASLASTVDCEFLITFLFNRVHNAMCRPEWSQR